MPASTTIGIDILARGLPRRLSARLVEEAGPDEEVIGIAAQAVFGAHAVERQVGEEVVEMRIVGGAVTQDARDLDLPAPEHEIAVITGHASLREIARYTKAADQRRLARAAMEKVSAKQEQKLSNLGDGLTIRGKK
jgi:hypothetical protein